MCGISGFFSSNSPIQSANYYPAHYLLSHRGPDDEGFAYLDKDEKVQLARGNDTIQAFQYQTHIQSIEKTRMIIGQRRLSIIDLSKAGHQPFVFEGLYMVFNGELFNYKELREELRGLGYIFETQSDTEVVIKAYHHWRDEAFNKFNGFWALAIFDSKNDALVLSRDRFGIKPLYYHFEKGVLYFASEMKYILSMARISWELNQNAVQTYLYKNMSSHSTTTFWKDIYELEPAHTMTLRHGELTKKRYWNFKPSLIHRTPEAAFEEFTYLFEDSIKLRMQSDVEVGSLLSGGLDSTTIVCTLQKLGFIDKNNFKSFSGIHDEANYTETKYIHDTVRKTGLKAAYIKTNPKRIEEDLPKLNLHIEEPFRSLAVYTQFLIYKHLRETSDVTVVINGQGADELFGGYNEQYRVLLAEHLSKMKLTKFWKELMFLKNYRQPTYQRIFRLNFIKMVQRALVTPHFFNKDGMYQISTSPLREYFKYDDRNAMTFGVEARAPFMDYRLVEFGLTLATDFKINHSINKKIVRDYAAPIIPESVRNRKDKMGFTTPQATWQRNELKPSFDQTINKIIDDKFFNIPDLGKAYKAYQNKNQGDFYYFWRVYNLYHWCKTWQVF